MWLGLDRAGDKVDWLRVETPRVALENESLPIRIHLGELKQSTQVCVDLHWSPDRNSAGDFLASGGSKRVGPEGGSFDFEVTVPPREGLRYVHGIIFLSPTGEWEDHTFVAATDPIRVSTNRGAEDSSLTRLSVHQQEEPLPRTASNSSSILRWANGVLLLAASILAGINFRSTPEAQQSSSIARRLWLIVATALALAAGWELFDLENRVGNLARAWARAEDVYFSREGLQRMSVSAIVSAAIVLLSVVWSKRWPGRSLLVFFGLYLVVSCTNLLSLHTLDKFGGISWHGVSLVDGLKFISVMAVLIATIHTGTRTRRAQ